MPTNVPNPFADGIRSLGASLFDPTAKAKAAQIQSQLSTDELQRQKLRLDIGQTEQQQGATKSLADMFGGGSLLETKPDGTVGISKGMRNEYVKNYLLSRPNAPHSEILNALNTYEASVVKQKNAEALQAAKPLTGAQVEGQTLLGVSPQERKIHALGIKPLPAADGSFLAPPAMQKIYEGTDALDMNDAPPAFVPSAPGAKPSPTSLIPELPTGAMPRVIPGTEDAGLALFGDAPAARPASSGTIAIARQPEQAAQPGSVSEAFATNIPTMGPKRPVAPEGRKLSPVSAKIQGDIIASTDSLNALQKLMGANGEAGILDENPNAFGVHNYLPDAFVQRGSSDGYSNGRIARAKVMDLSSRIIKERAGTAQSPHELETLKSFTIRTTDSTDTVRDKLSSLRDYLNEHVSTLKKQGEKESGYIMNPKIAELIDQRMSGSPAPQAQPATQGGMPAVGSTFNGSKVLKIERVK